MKFSAFFAVVVACLNVVVISADDRCPIVLDLRVANAYRKGHASCAKKCPFQDDDHLLKDLLDFVGNDKTHPVVIYGIDAVGHKGPEGAKKILLDQGYTQVTNAGSYAGRESTIEEYCNCPKTTKAATTKAATTKAATTKAATTTAPAKTTKAATTKAVTTTAPA